ncbi:hypothetical protein KIN20_001773 [Parelaphostrongylus tenuis]|uniref:Uncharacterized protein n=1 Tax=Parelaphostrongylus tenuis TaxID=148309 RepID=A0AAD5QCX4_PARTN|nr:hypothetical protein KIN20_001773 [Parelaphostrongylus tenuis]
MCIDWVARAVCQEISPPVDNNTQRNRLGDNRLGSCVWWGSVRVSVLHSVRDAPE